jgi:membrane-bound lytic murein transglycosylase B
LTISSIFRKRALRSPLLAAVLVMSVVCDPGIWGAAAQPSSTASNASFEAFLQELWPEAERKGVTRSTFDQAFAGVTPDPRVIMLTRNQPEYGKPVGTYIETMASQARIDAGLRQATQQSSVLDAVEQRFGVDRWVILAIWGIETSFGAEPIRWDIIRSLSTFAQAHYRDPFFRDELIAALKILQNGHLSRDQMLGSWAGAMGQPQFMPSTYIKFAVAFSGNGKPNIWTSVPDVLASIANYLNKAGWKPGLPWGFEVVVPANFDYRRSRASFQEWANLGVMRADGGAYPPTGHAILFFPSCASGPAFLVTENFLAIKRYNNSDVYALAAGQLANRMRGEGPIRAPWPPEDRQLTLAERIGLQQKLAALGYDVHDFQGRFDFDLRDSIREVQTKFGFLPDGCPTAALLDRLGVTAQ